MKLPELHAEQITTFQYEWTQQWHSTPTSPQDEMPWSQIEQNHRMNFALWHEEDIARRDDLGAERIREAKRTIDSCNQARNNAVEQMDAWIKERLPPAPDGTPLHSETPGMIIDRLSILALKHYHMCEEAQRESAGEEHRQQCGIKAKQIQSQLAHLGECLEILLQQLAQGERTFKLYKQFKMYNDPALNPQLYQNPDLK